MTTPIDEVLAGMQRRSGALPAELEPHRAFLDTYRRTTVAVQEHVRRGFFADGDWVQRWDAAFAELYFTALDGRLSASGAVSRPWRLAFSAAPELHPLLHVLLGLNAHVNFDLPQSLLAVIGPADFADPVLLGRRFADHERIDAVLSSQVAAEDQALGPAGRRVRDRLLTPVNRLASRRFLREGRQRVWHNTLELQAARLRGPQAYAARLAELEVLSAARIADLLRPGQVLLRLAVAGFGVTLPPAADEVALPPAADETLPAGTSAADATPPAGTSAADATPPAGATGPGDNFSSC